MVDNTTCESDVKHAAFLVGCAQLDDKWSHLQHIADVAPNVSALGLLGLRRMSLFVGIEPLILHVDVPKAPQRPRQRIGRSDLPRRPGGSLRAN